METKMINTRATMACVADASELNIMPDDSNASFPESWTCIDCGVNTAPGCSTREQFDQALAAGNRSVKQHFDEHSEIYAVRAKIWKASGMEDFGGCLCIGCLEKRIGRKLRPKDFMRSHPFSMLPGTERLLKRRGG
jgi:hypothetical protein